MLFKHEECQQYADDIRLLLAWFNGFIAARNGNTIDLPTLDPIYKLLEKMEAGK